MCDAFFQNFDAIIITFRIYDHACEAVNQESKFAKPGVKLVLVHSYATFAILELRRAQDRIQWSPSTHPASLESGLAPAATSDSQRDLASMRCQHLHITPYTPPHTWVHLGLGGKSGIE